MSKLDQVDLEAEAQKLAELSEQPKEKVLAEIQAIINTENRPPLIAVIVWKARNSFQLGAGRTEVIGRVIAVEGETRTQAGNRVANVHLAVEDAETKEIVFKSASLWDDRIESLGPLFEEDRSYRLACSLRADGNITRISKVTEMEEPTPIPKLNAIKPTPIQNIVDSGGQHDLVHGWVGRLITGRTSPEVLGVELGDLDSPLPITIWFGGQFSRMKQEDLATCSSLNVGDEAIVYGYVNLAGSNVSMRAVRIVKVA